MPKFTLKINSESEVPELQVFCETEDTCSTIGSVVLTSAFADKQSVLDVANVMIESWKEDQELRLREQKKKMELLPKEVLEMDGMVLETKEAMADVTLASISEAVSL